MSKRVSPHLVLFFLLFHHFLMAQEIPFLKVGYLPSYRFHLLDSLDLDKLTHLCIAFANPNQSGKISFNNHDIGPIVRKAKAANVKILLSLGGGLESNKVKAWDHCLKPWNRPGLVHEIMNWVRTYDFDGVDVDLEWGNVKPTYEPFVLTLKDSILKENKLLTAALPGTKRYDNLTDRALEVYDYIFVMAYDLTGPWAPRIKGQHSPFSMAVQSINFWKNQGVEAERLVLGLPFYGWDFTNPKRTYSTSYGFLAARDSTLIQLDRFGDVFFNGKPLIEAKTELALKQAGGVMFWELGQDAFNSNSLVKAADKVVNEFYDDYLKQEIDVDAINTYEPTSVYSKSSAQDYIFSTNSKAQIIFTSLANSQTTNVDIPNFPTGIFVLEHLIKEKFWLNDLLKKR